MPNCCVDESIPIDKTFIHHLGPAGKGDKPRDYVRSLTPSGFATAVFLSNHKEQP